MIGVSKIRYQLLMKWSKVIMIITIILLIAVFIMGAASHGAQRWINLGFISFQPSEIAKVSLIIYMAYICSTKTSWLKTKTAITNW